MRPRDRRSRAVANRRRIDILTSPGFFPSMTATQVIRQIKKLPDAEQAKVRRYVYRNHVPNETTRKALRESEAGKGLVRCTDIGDLFAKLKV